MSVDRKTIVYLRLVVISLIIFQSLLGMGNIGLVCATSEPRLIEADESISPFPTLSSITNILLSSPMRIGDTGGGGNDWVAVNAQYNQPRTGDIRMHLGVDLASHVNNSPASRKLFSTGNGRFWYRNWHSSYGYYGGVQNQHPEGVITYEFQTFYAHLKEQALIAPTTPVFPTSHIGNSGNTGESQGIHLHLEFRVPTQQSGVVGWRRYPPSFFYWRVGTWGSDTSFINMGLTSGNTVNFRIVDIAIGHVLRDVPASNVGLIFRVQGSGIWYGNFGNMTKSGHNFSFNFASLGAPAGTVFEYYIQAKSNTWDGTLRTAYRPYLYADGNPPDTKLFSHTVNYSPTGFASAHPIEYDPSLLKEVPPPDPFALEADYRKAVVVVREIDIYTVLAREVEGRTPADKPKLGRQVILNITGPRGGFTKITTGGEYMITGKITSLKPLTVFVPNTDFMRILINEGD